MVVASTGASTSSWKWVAPPPQMLGGQANPVMLSMPTMSCQPPVPETLGAIRAVEPSKPELNKRFAETGDVRPVGGEVASLGNSDTFAPPHPASRLMTAIPARSSNKRPVALRRFNPPAGCAGKPRDALRFQFM